MNHVGAGLPLNVQDQRLRAVGPGGELGVLGRHDDVGDVREADRGSVQIGHRDVPVPVNFGDLIVCVDRGRLRGTVEAPLGRIAVGIADGRAQIVDVEAVGCKRLHLRRLYRKRPSVQAPRPARSRHKPA